MASPKELRAAIIETRAQLQEALHGAHAAWERKPAAGEGEDAWSPRQVAEHVIGSEWFFTNGVGQACGAPPMERPTVEAPTPAAAAAAATRIGGICDNVLRHVSDGDLTKTFELGRSGPRSVEEMMQIIASHGQDHVNQLKAASA